MMTCGGRILLIEDDEFKLREIEAIARGVADSWQIVCASSVQAAIAMIQEADFQLIILDMALPSHSLKRGEGAPQPMPSGGVEVLMELNYLERKEDVIIVTQYPEIEIDGEFVALGRVDRRIKGMMNVNLRGVVLSEKQSGAWHPALRKLIEVLIA